MDAYDLLREGRLDDALRLQTEAVKSRPSDVDARYVMVAVLALLGEFDRAERHLTAIAELHPELAAASAVYSGLVTAEEERRRVYQDGETPGLAPDVPDALHARAALRRHLARGDAAAAQTAWQQVQQAGGGDVGGEVDGRRFGRIRDYDDSLGDVLEVFAGGRYLWLPWRSIRSLSCAPPRGLLDLIWARCDLTDARGIRATVHVPVLYAGTAGHADPLVRSGRKTEWQDEAGLVFRGHGPRILLLDEDEVPFLSLRELTCGGGAEAST